MYTAHTGKYAVSMLQQDKKNIRGNIYSTAVTVRRRYTDSVILSVREKKTVPSG
jgi:hypothetical protein